MYPTPYVRYLLASILSSSTAGHSHWSISMPRRAREPLFQTLASLHNVMHMNQLMAELRQQIYADEI